MTSGGSEGTVRKLCLCVVLAAIAGCAIESPPPVTGAPAPAVVAAVPVPPPSAPVPTVVYPGVPDLVSLVLPAIPVPPGRLTLSNFSFPIADVEALVTAYPDCAPHPDVTPIDMKLPLNGAWVIPTPPGADACWRRALPPTAAAPRPISTGWNRVYTGTGRLIDSHL